MTDEPPVTHSLLVLFPDQSASFVHGFEAGKLWRIMSAGDVAEIHDVTHIENREVIRRMADHLGWDIELKPTEVEGWDELEAFKSRKGRGQPNPHGLRVVP